MFFLKDSEGGAGEQKVQNFCRHSSHWSNHWGQVPRSQKVHVALLLTSSAVCGDGCLRNEEDVNLYASKEFVGRALHVALVVNDDEDAVVFVYTDSQT